MVTNIASQTAGQEKVVPTFCASHCGGSCLLKVHVRDGIITKIETDDGDEPQLRGCFRGRAYRQRVYDPDRILYPLKRVGERGEGKFQRISWDEALTAVANEIKRIRDTYGPASILYTAMAGDVSALSGGGVLFTRLLNMAGGFTGMSGITSFGQGIFSSIATYGTYMCSNSRDDLLNSRLIILWGFDPAKCINGTNTAWYLAKAKERGARIISVDPRLGDTSASVADQWITIRPSTDAAMLIAMAYAIVAENLQDQAFLNRYTVGFDKYRDYLLGTEDGMPKTPAWAEDITGVPAETIAALAREYAVTKPGALLAGIGPGRTHCGEMYHRAAAVLAAMCGNIGIHGGDAAARAWESIFGGLPYQFMVGLNSNPMPRVRNPVDEGFPVMKSYLPRMRGPYVFWAKVPDAIIRGKAGGYHADYKMFFIANCNYLNATPNINKVVEALKRLEFIVVNEQVMTPTARFADIVLPQCTYLERNDITVVAQTYLGYGFQNKVIEPLGESKSPLDICMALAEKLGLSDYNDKTEEELLREVARRAGIPDYDKFKKQGIYRIPMSEPYVAFQKQIEDPANNPFPTPSGKIEICSSVMAEWDNPELPPIPKWVEPFEILTDPLAKKYPLQLITPHGKRRALGQYERVPWLREVEPQTVWINMADARARGIRTGDMVRVFNDRGVLVLPAEVTRRLMPGVVQVESGAWYDPDEDGIDRGGNSNVLTRDDPSIGGHFCYNTCLVEVRKEED